VGEFHATILLQTVRTGIQRAGGGAAALLSRNNPIAFDNRMQVMFQ
jgi:hypothetical protein